ncbi:hypothetical protein [Pedobacter aquatilis]|uniref:hypothetical protein n=1 Tax=Pedobacter aquatilis TaxID=351343 RepID=UPI0029302100|nr:hypothetical protein [Pedobacter aquatilis]
MQDRQGFRRHITIQNKVDVLTAKMLLEKLATTFQPFEVTVLGVDLWYYPSGSWKYYHFIPFD